MCMRALCHDWPQGELAHAQFLPFHVFFPLPSGRGHHYLLVYVEVDSHLGDSFRRLIGEQKARSGTISNPWLPPSPPHAPSLCQFLHPDPLLRVLSLVSFCHLSVPCSHALSRPCFMDLSPPLHCFCLVSTVHLLFTFILTSLKAFVQRSPKSPSALQTCGIV